MARLRAAKRWRRSIVLAVLVSLATAGTTYALTAANVFNAGAGGKAGDGQAGLGSYSISSVHYTLDQNHPQTISSWLVALSGPTPIRVVYSRLLDNGGNVMPAGAPNNGWVACTPTNSSGPFTCTPSSSYQPTTYLARSIQVTASS
ncbi:MAG: hypothetical protein ACXVP1_06080 [Thermoleophilia bacterium]